MSKSKEVKQYDFNFTVGVAKVYDAKTDSLIDKSFSFKYSELDKTKDDIKRKAVKALKGFDVVAVKEWHRVQELRTVPTAWFFANSELKRVIIDGKEVTDISGYKTVGTFAVDDDE